MADQKKRMRTEHDNISTKTQELLTQFSSTVFAFDTSGDTRYVRCDFPQCKQHAEALQGKRCWLLNTMKNVKVLERHVGKEVHHYMKERDTGTGDQVKNPHYVDSEGFLEKQCLPEGTRKVLAVFNLKDPQSQFGDWISLFLKAAFMAEGTQNNDCVVITQNFVSRQELIECIARLSFLNSHLPTVEVVTVLSCHSSCQGQVFSCTPFVIAKESGFEEFCSLHNFVMACQTVLKDVLMATHISSCFTLKLDCSHADWPVDADWLKTKLHSILCGSTKEVYETGSQVADLHLMLSTMISNKTTGTCGTRLKDAVHRARSEGFPDLAREMGLGFLGRDNVDERLSTEGREDQVTPPGLVMSSMRVVFLVQDDFPCSPNQEANNSRQFGSYLALADAIVANLRMRKASDVKFEYMVFQMKVGEINLLQESLKNYLSLLPSDTFKVLFIAVGPMFSRPNLELSKLVKEWSDLRAGDICYGLHFQHVTAMQAFVIKTKLKEIQSTGVCGENMEKASCSRHLAVTGLVEDDNRNCSASFPVLLYMIHLAIGENGNRLAGKGIPSAVYSKKPVGHGLSSWTLEEVYMETCHVLSGLSRKCGLHLLSAASSQPVSSTSAIGTFAKAEGDKLQPVQENVKHTGPSSCDVQRMALSEQADPSSRVAFPTMVSATTTDGSALESFHGKQGDSDVFSNTLTTGKKEPGTFTWQDKTPLASSAGLMGVAKCSEGDGNNDACGSDCRPFADNTELSDVTCHEMPSSSISTVMEAARLPIENDAMSLFDDIPITEGQDLNDVMCYDNPSSTLNALSVTSPLGEDSVSSKEQGSKSKVGNDEHRLVEEPNRVMCLENTSSTFRSSSTIHVAGESVCLQEEEERNDGGSSLYEETDRVTSHQKPSVDISSVGESAILAQKEGSTIELVDDEYRVLEEAASVLCHKDPSSAINLPSGVSQLREGTSLLDEKGGTMELADNEVPFYKGAAGVMCCEKPCSAITPVGKDANLAEKSKNEEGIMQPVDDEDGFGESSYVPSHENLSAINYSDATNVMVEGTTMETVSGKDRLDEEPNDKTCDLEIPSSLGTSVADQHPIQEKRKKNKNKKKNDKKKKRIKSAVTTSATRSCTLPNGVKMNMSFQTWLQNFTDYCKGQNQEVAIHGSSFQDSNSQDASGSQVNMERSPEGCFPRNLESNDTCHATQSDMRTVCVSSTNMSQFVFGDASGEHIGTSDHEDIERESDYFNVFERIEKKGNEITEDAQFNTETRENKEIEIESEDSFARKRSLSTDNSGDVAHNSTKKTKNESDSECKERTGDERSLDNKWDKSDDLPLMANVDEVHVYHYILDLSVKFSEKIMKGNIVLFLEPRNEEVTKRQFQMTLDSSLVNIESVSEVVLPEDFQVTFCGHKQSGLLTQEPSSSEVQNGFLGNILGDKSHTPLPFKGLSYSVYGWCVQIWKPEATGKAWPKCVWIKYHTSPEGSSLTWATDQDGKPSVYSPGAYINNRSLMPCQEPPVAMSTWQAAIHVPEGCVVLMSGNQFVGKTTENDNQETYHYEMDCPLPCSTLALAVGWWQCRQSRNADTKNGENPNVPVTCRLFAPPCLIDRAADELLGYAPKFLEASCDLLGPYPFRRLDMLILPKCFACMGLKSPNLVFLSQSLLSGDASMRVRLAHEISHAWFGLLVGAKDWSEEWLSEGFATFIEEKIQSKAEKWSRDKDSFFREMRQILRHRCLLAEIRECDDNLKCLRPKAVKPTSAISAAEAVEKSSVQRSDSVSIKPHSVVQFGQICSRKWTQVHYLKGYFLLHRMASMVGLEEFDQFLFSYVQHFREQLVTSEDFFGFFIESFPDVPREMKDKLIREWLERPGLPRSFPKKFNSPDNELVSQVENEFQVWKKQDMINKRNKTLKVRKRKKPPSSTLEVAEQVVLLLEKLLEREAISHSTLRQLDKCYSLSNGNAEIRHRWCELVVKHKYSPGLPDVQRFLVEDQGMGIYLFGELIISQQPRQRALVDEVLAEIGPEMDRCTYQTVKDMLEGND